MNFILMARGLCSAAAAATLSIACATIALAETITVTDINISQGYSLGLINDLQLIKLT